MAQRGRLPLSPYAPQQPSWFIIEPNLTVYQPDASNYENQAEPQRNRHALSKDNNSTSNGDQWI
jgi:hypothetical protein